MNLTTNTMQQRPDMEGLITRKRKY